MNIVRSAVAVSGLVLTLALCLTAASSARAQGAFHHPHPFYHPHPYRHAAALDRRAAQAASHGHYRRADQLRHQAAHLRAAARHGY